MNTSFIIVLNRTKLMYCGVYNKDGTVTHREIDQAQSLPSLQLFVRFTYTNQSGFHGLDSTGVSPQQILKSMLTNCSIFVEIVSLYFRYMCMSKGFSDSPEHLIYLKGDWHICTCKYHEHM